MIRWAWRLFRREIPQQLILLALVAVAVGGTVIGAAVAADALPPDNLGYGTANHLVTLSGPGAQIGAQIAALRERFGTVDAIEQQSLVTGLAQGAQLRAEDPQGPYSGPLLSLVSGAYPQGSGQVAMTGDLATTYSVHLGGYWQDGAHRLRVVGIVRNPQNLADSFALVAPGQLGVDAPLGAPDTATVLFDTTAAALAAEPLPDGLTAENPQPSQGLSPTTIVLAVAVLMLTFTGLVAVAGFAALARRRRRALGMLAALGATDRDVRLVLVANGAIVGLVGALIGAVLGLAAWIGYAPRFSISAGRIVPWTQVPWWLVGVAMLLAVCTAALAAWFPAAAAARMSVVEALSGRPAPAAPAYRSAGPALLLLIAGPVLLASSGGWGADGGGSAPMQLGGLLLSAVGVALIAPFTVARLGLIAGRTPIAVRLALRDLARYRSRSAAALAAGSLAILIAMLVTLITTARYADPVDYFGPNLATNQLIVYAPGDGPGTGRGPGSPIPAPDREAAFGRQADAVAAALGVGPSAMLPLQPVETDLLRQVALQKTTGNSTSIYLATPAVLAHYGIPADAIEPGAALLTSRQGLAGLSGLFLLYGDLANPAPNAPTFTAKNPSIQTLGALPTDTSAPNLLMTESAVRKLGISVDPVDAWMIQTLAALTPLQINTARQLAVKYGVTVEVKTDAPALAQVRNDATAIGILIALGVLAMTVGLIRSESVGDLRILTATGASRRTRRGITAATAGTIGLLAAVSGTVVAYVDTATFFGLSALQRLEQIPGLDLILILVGLPALAALGGWLLAGREPAGRLAMKPLE